MKDYDVLVIGAGTAGLNAYRQAKAQGKTAALIDGGPLGTTCARVGCMPSKLLISAANANHAVKKARMFGIETADPVVNDEAVLKRVRFERDRFVGFVMEGIDNIPEEHLIREYAEFIDDHTVQLSGGRKLSAKTFVLAVGSRPRHVPILDGAEDLVLSSDHIFEIEKIPERVAVFGPGVIGLELGQALSRLGADVRLFGRSGSIGGIRDPEIRDYATKAFAEEFYTDTKATIHSVRKEGGKAIINYDHKEKGRIEESFDFILTASGRVSNTDRLKLENTSIVLSHRKVPAYSNSTMQCGDSHFFIAGDANDEIPLLHEASDEGKIAGKNAATFPKVDPGHRRTQLGIVFSDPEIASIGQSYESFDELVIGRVSFEGQGRSRVMGKNKGLMHLYAEKGDRRLRGAQIFGPSAEHLGHLIAWTVQQGLTVDQILEMPFYHPVIEEGLRTALQDLQKELDQV
ncbi:dihydrolipoyl dehydrogenase [Lentisphaera profundi]|uniref:Dihydrolipoyl dehydrogenase n=1 Tax=Lentisphaera profundi TaxID=1658616 RepID=A0ABY7VX07_9BACT|nr:dihydrolipoyl dehydrogenase [Lentisphaera profundi]WDE98446.1 dihydrolipoyl dehydrogenase [Lentisphaera profundi]